MKTIYAVFTNRALDGKEAITPKQYCFNINKDVKPRDLIDLGTFYSTKYLQVTGVLDKTYKSYHPIFGLSNASIESKNKPIRYIVLDDNGDIKEIIDTPQSLKEEVKESKELTLNKIELNELKF